LRTIESSVPGRMRGCIIAPSRHFLRCKSSGPMRDASRSIARVGQGLLTGNEKMRKASMSARRD
jgi:hypothetical protein